jgi:hypothetical protein
MSETIELMYDCDNDYMYQKVGESEAEYEARMAIAREKRNELMSNKAKKQAEELIKDFEEFAKKRA